MALPLALLSSAIGPVAAAAILAPLAASGGLWVARATDPALSGISAVLRPSSWVLGSGLAVALAVAAAPVTPAGFGLCACLAASAAADRDQLVLPDILTLVAIALAVAGRPFAGSQDRLGLLAVGGALYLLGCGFAWAMRAWRGQAAFGQGDVKLIAGLGMILPPVLIGPAVLAGALSALASACRPGRSPGRAIALGLHLVVGTGVALAAGAAFPALVGR